MMTLRNKDTPLIEAQNLTKAVQTTEGNLCILDQINLKIMAASTLAIVGVSGSGKSTLLGLLAGLDIPTSGEVLFNNVPIGCLSEDERARLRLGKVGFVFQSFQLLPSMTALENVMLPLELANQKDAIHLAKQSLQEVGLAHRTSHYPNQLSGGEQQRCAIARAFVSKPEILFADEPTGNLDQKTGDGIIQLLLKLNQDYKTTLVLVTHDKKLAASCDQQIILDEGKVQVVAS